MSTISTKIIPETFPLTRTLFEFVAENTPNGKSMKCTAPLLSYIFVEGITSRDMRMPIVTDYPGIVLFAKDVPQKSPPYKVKRRFYSIGLSFCSFIHYESGMVLDDSIFDLWIVDREYVENYVFFAIGNDIVDLSTLSEDQIPNVECYTKDTEELIEPKISEFIKLASDNAYLMLGYYIKNSSYDYIHCFLGVTHEYKTKIGFFGIIDNLRRTGKTALDLTKTQKFDIIKELIKGKGAELIQQISECKTSQDINIEIAKFMCECLPEFFFDIPV